jgi:hypothetical protein
MNIDEINQLRDRLSIRLNNYLIGMNEGQDDSITGFNEACDVMMTFFNDLTEETLGEHMLSHVTLRTVTLFSG